jgi:hypothetical protein
MITATYAPGVAWSPRHISGLVDRYQQWGKARGFKVPIVWVAELTKAGVVHYHLLIWLPRGYTPPKPDKQGWWRHGSTNCQWARSAVGYLAKYASKGGEASYFPPGLRLYGRAGYPPEVTLRVVWALAPLWLRKFVPMDHGVERVRWETAPPSRGRPSRRVTIEGGWWRDLKTGIEYRSPYRARFIPGVGVELTLVPWTEESVRFP